MTFSMRRAVQLLVQRAGDQFNAPPLLRASGKQPKSKHDVDITALEERLCFSATPLAALVDDLDTLDALDNALTAEINRDHVENDLSVTSADQQVESQTGLQLIFVDGSVEDADRLIEDIQSNLNAHRRNHLPRCQ